MSYDGAVTSAMAQELRANLVLGKIEKIYQPQPEQLLMNIHTQKGRKRLFISASSNHSAVYLVDETPENPEKPPTFCMVLRKHLGAARITDIVQHENDRILEILMETVDELGFNVNRKLIIEIMGKHSNVLLIDMNTGKIIDSIKHISIDVNRARQILPGKLYEYPPAQSKIPFSQVTEEQVAAIIYNQLQPERNLLDAVQGISPPLALSLVTPDASSVYKKLQRLTESIGDMTFTPTVYIDSDSKPADFHIFPLAVYEEDSTYSSISFHTLSEAAQYFFSKRESSNTVKQKANDLRRVVKAHQDKLKLKVQRLREDLHKAENADKYRLYGELLTANLHLAKQGESSVTVTNYYDSSQLSIPMDAKYSPAKNAQNYYKKYGKFKTALKEKQLQLDDTFSELDYLDSVMSFIDRASSLEEVNLIRTELIESGYIRFRKSARGTNKKDKPAPYSYSLSSGLSVLVGRNNKENDWLTFKKASSTDLWFHTKDIPGSHVILLLDGGEPKESDIMEAAAIAAYHSKGATSENVPVDYTKVRYVKKPSGSKPGFVIFTHNRTVYVNPSLT